MNGSDSTRQRLALASLMGAVLAVLFGLLWLVPDGQRGSGLAVLPALNAGFNASSVACLLAGWFFIRRSDTSRHRRAMMGAMAFSVAFFLGYVIHHAKVGSVPFERAGWVRALYFSVLIPHIVLAAPLLPMALGTFYLGITGKRAAHKRLARRTFPLWIFVSLSGVVVYCMLYQL